MCSPWTNSSAVLLSMSCRSQATCPWLLLSVCLRINSQHSVFDLEHFTAVMFGLTVGKTPFSLSMVSTGLFPSSHVITVQAVLEVLHLNLASSPPTTVRLAGVSFICVLAAKDMIKIISCFTHIVYLKHLKILKGSKILQKINWCRALRWMEKSAISSLTDFCGEPVTNQEVFVWTLPSVHHERTSTNRGRISIFNMSVQPVNYCMAEKPLKRKNSH